MIDDLGVEWLTSFVHGLHWFIHLQSVWQLLIVAAVSDMRPMPID